MLPHKHFFSLRLAQFLAPETIETFDSWRFMGRDWLGEAFGATEFLRSKKHPDELRLIALDMVELPLHKVDEILGRLGLALRPGMDEQEIIALFGSPQKVHDFLPYRETLDYHISNPEPYQMSLTLIKDQGLSSLLLWVEA
ncbi:hypothetical protein P2G88_08755 [Aliiglaciecola sp. CAU 1673]|uniref:hypothetical protein n=1 Tax=Aliiglaciecola sp. CAU 1673 TaxID=3032595 RepID=UPI0023D9DD56|nr:hypothetical protein [Aliiglaciecola sp. CAU 1673]MDF2178339.1 hypothetical protein [Aliiglaciecola sp. CAU 1673]